MNIYQSIFFILFLFLGSASEIVGQSGNSVKSVINLEFERLYVKMDNPLRIVARQSEPVSIDQLEAFLIINDSLKVPIDLLGDNGYFVIRPDTLGTVEISVEVGDIIETTRLRVHPIRVLAMLASSYGGKDHKISVPAFISQRGIVAEVACCYISARCKMLGFQLIRIGSRNQIERSINIGGQFEGRTREIIDRATPGDLYIFRNIRSKCPGSDQPQRLDDMIFEIE